MGRHTSLGSAPIACLPGGEAVLVYPRPPSRNPVGPTAPPEKNGHFLLCDLVDVHQLPSWPTVSSTGMLGRGFPQKNTTTPSPSSTALVPPSSFLCIFFIHVLNSREQRTLPFLIFAPHSRPHHPAATTISFLLTLLFPFLWCVKNLILEVNELGKGAVTRILPGFLFLIKISKEVCHPSTYPLSLWAEGV